MFKYIRPTPSPPLSLSLLSWIAPEIDRSGPSLLGTASQRASSEHAQRSLRAHTGRPNTQGGQTHGSHTAKHTAHTGTAHTRPNTRLTQARLTHGSHRAAKHTGRPNRFTRGRDNGSPGACWAPRAHHTQLHSTAPGACGKAQAGPVHPIPGTEPILRQPTRATRHASATQCTQSPFNIQCESKQEGSTGL